MRPRGYAAGVAGAVGLLAVVGWSAVPRQAAARPAPGQRAARLVIPFLANATNPSSLEFEGAECELQADGQRMTCEFEQVMLTTTDLSPQTCFVTTNRYPRSFQRESAATWSSRSDPSGECGIVEAVLLRDGGGVRWTMDLRKVVTRRDASAACRAAADEVETFSWEGVRRPLPCAFVQPGALR